MFLMAALLLIPMGMVHAQLSGTDFEHYNTRNGLPHEHVTCIEQDSRGFLWIGTFNGLARYDGYEFEVLKIGSTETIHSYQNAISALHSDSQKFWVGTTGGLLGYLSLTSLSWHAVPLPLKANNKPYSITDVVSNDSFVFASTYGGKLLTIEKSTGIVGVQSLSEKPILHIDLLNGMLLASTETSLEFVSLDSTRSPFKLPKFDSRSGALVPNKSTFLQQLGDSFLFTKLGTSAPKPRPIEVTYSGTLRVFPIPRGYLMISNTTIVEIDFEGIPLKEYALSPTEAHPLNPNEITTAYSSNDGLIWLGTYTGLKKLLPNRQHFSKYSKNSGVEPLPFNYIRSIHSSENDIWLGSKKDVLCKMEWNEEKGTLLPKPFSIVVDDEPATATVNTFLTLSNGSLLAAGLEGIWILEKEQFVPYAPFKWSVKGEYPQIWSLSEDRYGRIWAGTLRNGILIIDPKNHHLQSFTAESSAGLSSNTVWTLFTDHEKNIWAGTKNGLDSIAYSKNEYSAWPLHSIVNDSMDGKEVWQILEDDNGNFWIGTTDRGLSYFDRTKRRITNFHKEDGLVNETVAGLAFDTHEKHLWISSLDGLYRLNTANKSISPWTIKDGLLSNEFNFKAIATGPTGKLLLGSKSGLTSFQPDALEAPHGNYPLQICKLRVNNIPLPAMQLLELEPQNRHFSAAFALLEYTSTSKHRFRHRIKELGEDWTYLSEGTRIASYTHIPPGSYTLEIEASLGPHWHTAGSNLLKIEVPARLIEKSWFILLLSLILLLLIVLAVRSRIQRIKEKARIQVTIADLERRMLTAQMSPHFLFNSMNAIQQFVLCNESHVAQAYLGKFSKLIRMFLEASKRKLISLRDEIELLSTYVELERLRFENSFEVHFDIDEKLALDEIEIPNSLVQPFVENAILHGLAPIPQQGQLLLRITQQMHTLLISVDDNGTGRTRNSQMNKNIQHHPKGMSLVQDLATSYSSLEGFPETHIDIIDKKDSDGKPLGTRVNITIALC